MKTRILAIVVLLIFMVECTKVGAAPAIIVLEHGFAENYNWTSNGHLALFNETYNFTQDDVAVYAYVKATFYSANLTWAWYDPAGELVYTYGGNANCVASPCDFIGGLRISGTWVAAKVGEWRVAFLADGTVIYSDYFWLRAVITQDNYWSFTVGPAPPFPIQGSLRVVIHPSNRTWSYYRIYMPYAANITAYDYRTMHPLSVTANQYSRVVVSLGEPRSGGYSFVLHFGLSVSYDLGGGNYVIAWREYPWERYNDVHTIREEYNITLPKQMILLDLVGYNSMDLKYNATQSTGRSVVIAENVTGQPFGWALMYRDISGVPYANSNGPVNSVPRPLLPLLPISLGGLSIWAAVMSVFLLTASELLSPIYSKGGYGILINRKRLRLAALLLVVIFMITIAYQLVLQQAVIQR